MVLAVPSHALTHCGRSAKHTMIAPPSHSAFGSVEWPVRVAGPVARDHSRSDGACWARARPERTARGGRAVAHSTSIDSGERFEHVQRAQDKHSATLVALASLATLMLLAVGVCVAITLVTSYGLAVTAQL